MSTTQEDYFGDAVEDVPRRRRHKHRSKHSKPHSHASGSESEGEISSRELVPEEREHKSSSRRRHRHREPVETYEPDNAGTETDGVSTDDGRRTRRKNRRHRRDRIPDDASSTVPDPDSEAESERASISSNGKVRTRRKSRGRKSSPHSDEGYDSNSELGKPRSRSGSRFNNSTAQAAMIAAAVQAFKSRKEPGGVTGSKGLRRVVEAAVASGAVEKFLDRKGGDDQSSKQRVGKSVLAGLATERGINGLRNRSRGRDDDNYDDDDDDDKPNPMRNLAATGLIAAAGKKFLDYQRSRSQSRGRANDDERPGLDRRRSQSVGKALAAVGLGGLASQKYGKSHRDSHTRKSRIQDGNSSDSSGSDSELSIDSDTEQKVHKRLRRKEIISIALALLATINLGQAGYEAHQKRTNRKEKLESGRITEEESEKFKHKALFQDAKAVGLAIFAATEAVKSIKAVQENRREFHKFEEKRPRISEHRRQRVIEDAVSRQGRIPSPSHSEASKYYSQPGYMGPPPGARDVPIYNHYPSSGPIPNSYASTQSAYSTRDGRDIPVVYPSSVTHA